MTITQTLHSENTGVNPSISATKQFALLMLDHSTCQQNFGNKSNHCKLGCFQCTDSKCYITISLRHQVFKILQFLKLNKLVGRILKEKTNQGFPQARKVW